MQGYYGKRYNDKNCLFLRSNCLAFVEIEKDNIIFKFNGEAIKMSKNSEEKVLDSLYKVYEGNNYSITFDKDESKDFNYQPILIKDKSQGTKEVEGFYNIIFFF